MGDENEQTVKSRDSSSVEDWCSDEERLDCSSKKDCRGYIYRSWDPGLSEVRRGAKSCDLAIDELE